MIIISEHYSATTHRRQSEKLLVGFTVWIKPQKQYNGSSVEHWSIVGMAKHSNFSHKPHNNFYSSAQQSIVWFGRNNTALWFTPKSPEGFETDTRDEGTGLWTADMQGFVLWLFRSAFVSSAAEGCPLSTRLQHSERRLQHWHCSVVIPSVWWQLAQRRDEEAGREHLDDAAASSGCSERHSHIHTHSNAQKHSEICTCRHVFTHINKYIL